MKKLTTEHVLSTIVATPNEMGLSLINNMVNELNEGGQLDFPQVNISGLWYNPLTGYVHYSVIGVGREKSGVIDFLDKYINPNLDKFN